MKKITLLLSICFFAFLGFSQCNYTLVLGDAYGDGWNNGQMVLVQNGDTIAFLNGPNQSPNFSANDTTILVPVTPGIQADLIWNVPGNWPSEMSVILYDENGIELFNMVSNSDSLALTTLFSSTPTCAPCSALPAPGNTLSSNGLSLCPGTNSLLTLETTTLGSGVTYQWYSSTDGINYTAISGDTSNSLSITATTDIYYYCAVTCSGFNSTNSNPVHITIAPYTQCYCTPQYTTGTSFGDLISNVSIGGTTLSNNTGFVAGDPSYTFFTGQPNYTATLVPSSSYSLSISTGEYGSQGYAAWIDYNDDGLFSSSEQIGYSPSLVGSGFTQGAVNDSITFTIALACNPPAGIHRMRIRGAYNVNGGTIDPCVSYGYGETEDYLVTIAPAPACPSAGQVFNSTTTQTTASISWLLGCSTATIFDIEYGPVGFTQGTGTTLLNQTVSISNDTASFMITGLTESTEYTVYYRAVCGGNSSMWSTGSNFYTLCNAIIGDGWCENFDAISSTENCWTILNLNGDATAWDMNDTGNSFNGTDAAAISTDFNGGNNDDYLITPQLILTGNEALVFNYKVRSSFEPNDFKVLVSTTGINPADFSNTIFNDTASNTTYQDTTLDLSAFSGNVYIAFQIPQGGLDGWVLYIDQVCVTSCPPVNINDDSADVCKTLGTINLNTSLNVGATGGQWSFPSNPTLLTGSDLNTSTLSSGVYQAFYIVSSNCSTDTAVATINVFGASFAGNDTTLTVCRNEPFDLFNSLSGSIDLGGTWFNPSNQALNGSLDIASNIPGQFNYSYVTSNGVCAADTSIVLVTVNGSCNFSGINEVDLSTVNLYPNPTTGVIHLDIDAINENKSVIVEDINGRIILELTDFIKENGNYSFNMGTTTNGIYFVKIAGKSGSKTFKIVKQ